MLITPVSAVANGDVAPHGYWKDLLNILALAARDELVDFPSRKNNFLRTYTPKPKRQTPRVTEYIAISDQERARVLRKERQQRFHERLVGKLVANYKFRALYIAVVRLFAQQLRKDVKILDELQTVDQKVDKDRYRTLARSISLVGKWAPTPGGSHDRVTNVSTAICQLLFSPNENSGPDAIDPLPSTAPHPIPSDQYNCVILRNYYHRWILRPLREILACPEPLMSAQRWTEIQYSRVPSICMARNKVLFRLHDPEGFQLYLVDVKSGKKKISGATLMPHELVGEAIELQKVIDVARSEVYPSVAERKRTRAREQLEVVDAQWRTLISRMKESGSLDSTLAVCDVSGSMGSIYDYDKHNVNPIFPSIALSLVVASVTKPPFNMGFITFSEDPEFVRLEGLEEKSLTDLVGEVLKNRSGGNTDLQAVFLKLLLPLAKGNNVSKEDMVKRLFVFSDMQFDRASGMTTGPWWLNRASESERADRWETSYDLIERAFREAGYEVPEIVFWDLAGERTVRQTVEVEAGRRGVAMMSGFSNAMMKVFMDESDGKEGEREEEEWTVVTEEGELGEEEEMTPLSVMKRALLRPSYNGLVILD